MFPGLPIGDSGYALFGDSEPAPEFYSGGASVAKPSDFYHVAGRELSSEVLFSHRPFGSSLRHGIVHVIDVRAEEQVFAVNAPPVVTLVANDKPFRDLAVGEFPRRPVGEKQAPRTTGAKPSVAVGGHESLPFNASVGCGCAHSGEALSVIRHTATL